VKNRRQTAESVFEMRFRFLNFGVNSFLFGFWKPISDIFMGFHTPRCYSRSSWRQIVAVSGDYSRL